ncbi:MFS transporter [Melioribacter sp. OK-6-Me]|uniref:MFS transporter n=1 Tax=unclassified Melioribacter TaxID=2627329 RepID=UPI003EDA33F1
MQKIIDTAHPVTYQKRNFFSLIWHAFWLALAETFADKNTILPALILYAGGTQTDVGYLTSIMIGVPLLSQLFFAILLRDKPHKKNFLLAAIYLRVIAFAGAAYSIFLIGQISTTSFIYFLLFWMFLFSVSGAFAGISYGDIVGKSFENSIRKKFFAFKQFFTGIGILFSAFLAKYLLNGIEFPRNYQVAFFSAASFLFIASFGFWMINEKASQLIIKKEKLLGIITREIKDSKTLRQLILISNLAGVSFVTLPFLIGYIKESIPITKLEVGNFLLIQISGMIASSLIWKKVVHRYSYKGMMRISIPLLASIPLLSLLINSIMLFYVLFFIIGGAIGSWKIIQEGAIIEISNEENRTLYLGLFGTLNLSLIIAPLFIGTIINYIDISYIFVTSAILTLISFFIIKKIVCPIDLKINLSI